MAGLPAEVCSQIARYTAQADLVSLCRVCRALQRPAESELYENLVLRDALVAYQAYLALVANNGIRGTYVRRFWFLQDVRRRSIGFLRSSKFWEALQAALITTVNLEYLYILDPSARNAWILDSPDFKFQLLEANLHMAWDTHMVAFLQGQRKLRFLHVKDSLDEGPLCALGPDSLQSLAQFSGPVLVLAELLACPLTHVQIALEEETTAALLPTVVSDLGRVMKNLRSLNVLYWPEVILIETLELISVSVFGPSLRYLGTISYPMMDRHDIHRCLVPMRNLEIIDLDLTAWMPPPIDIFQRMLATELRTFCPSLNYILFWMKSGWRSPLAVLESICGATFEVLSLVVVPTRLQRITVPRSSCGWKNGASGPILVKCGGGYKPVGVMGGAVFWRLIVWAFFLADM
ncbi:uncharacterized protein FIBRA_01790 [Fibroporia radiculosa]|uniref:F-box domain-containing protein n=1 Tax=Fibroporia radiculosa TaxID=599839 RepID=J4G166_9APHY|nr:uncharacterized protein FIBRA_01790 [Fibroporia radiculosa]CCL99768.1 predicted protein [Fibroporia radiculosa]